MLHLLERLARAAHDAGERIVRDMDRHLGRLRDAPIQARQERIRALFREGQQPRRSMPRMTFGGGDDAQTL